MAYHLEGRLLEVCNCRVLCPCWIGEDPDFGTCDTIVAWRFEKGSERRRRVRSHDRTDRGLPGNILEGNWRAAVYIDERSPRSKRRRSSRCTRASRAAP